MLTHPTLDHLRALWRSFGVGEPPGEDEETMPGTIPSRWRRTSAFLTHPSFHTYHAESSMLRYLRRLADKDLALDRTFNEYLTWTAAHGLPAAPRPLAVLERDGYGWVEFAEHESLAGGALVTDLLLTEYGPLTEMPAHSKRTKGSG